MKTAERTVVSERAAAAGQVLVRAHWNREAKVTEERLRLLLRVQHVLALKKKGK